MKVPVHSSHLSKVEILKRLFTLILFSPFIFSNAKAQGPVDPSSIIGKVVCGYQCWFNCTGDGSPINHWSHWSPGNPPQAGIAPNPNPNLTFDAYPDVSIYNSTSLFQTNFANQGNGNPSKLFSSFKQDVVDKHFQLMQANGIDGVAFQRFIWEVLIDPAYKANRDSAAVHVQRAAETYQRMFYLVYDLSGLGNVPAASDQVRFDSVKGDWQNNMIAKLHITSSPMYAKQGGKPVVQIWGIGYNHIIGTAAIQLDLINWFKNQGVYVIIGVPTGWRTGTGASNPGWINTYKAGNMISPWSVGAYTNQSSTDAFKTNFLTPDLSYCNSNGIAYQPVIFPGFSWSNWNGGTQNQIPRDKGNFLWRQAYNLRLLGIKTAEIAMMDEFDEGTAILPMADGYNMIPTNQYFVTTSADGVYLSSDFYLRVASKATRQINQLDAVNSTMPVSYSLGPIYFRTSNEAKYDAQPTWNNTTELKKNVTNYGSNSGNPTCAVTTAGPHNGLYSLKIAGRDRSSSSSYAYFKVWDVNIPISSNTELSFWSKPLNTLGRYTSIDLIMTDGSTLRDCGAVDANGISLHPATGRGTVNTWAKTVCNIGTWLNGKTIDRILVAYDHPSQTGDFSAYFDDISINIAGTPMFAIPAPKLVLNGRPVKSNVALTLVAPKQPGVMQYEIERSTDGIHFTNIKTLPSSVQEETNNYETLDANVLNTYSNVDEFYYRLKITGQGGSLSYSNIVLINVAGRQSVSVLNNPFRNNLNIRLTNQPKDKVTIRLYDAAGKLMISKEFKNPGNNIKLNTSFPGTGVYLLETTTEGKVFTNNLVKE
jgi:hypothetical protein